MSGEELLHANAGTRQPLFAGLISSGYPHETALPKVGFLLKPYLPKMLVEVIGQMLR